MNLVDVRHELHRFPETGLRLPRTQGLVRDVLTDAGLPVTPGRRCSSVTAVVHGEAPPPEGRPRPVVLLRADMDGLPLQETADVGYRSRTNGVMHACGHDMHTAGLLGAAARLQERRAELAGDVVLMFQPGEEGFDGARVMIDEGVLDTVGRRPDSAWAVHVMSNVVPAGVLASRPGPLMAACSLLTVTLSGVGGHGAAPHLARDALHAAAEMVTGLYALTFRSVSPFTPVVVSVGQFNAGSKPNIIPQTATFKATVRCFDPDVMDDVERTILRFCRGVAEAHGVQAAVEFRPQYPAMVNDARAVDVAEAVVRRSLGSSRWLDMTDPLATSEDFAHVLNEIPGAMILLGATPQGTDWRAAPMNHAPDVVFDDDVLPDVVDVYFALASAALAEAPAA